MARRGALGGFSLDLFGGGGVDASVFNIASESKRNEAYLALTRVEVEWEGGRVSNDAYLAALKTYADSFPKDSSEWLNQHARVEQITYRVERNVLMAEIDAGKKELADLLAYDRAKLAGLNKNSQEYLDRQSLLFRTQEALFNEEETAVIEEYRDGQLTTAQLREWYQERGQDARYTGNTGLHEEIGKRIDELKDRIVDERDAEMVNAYSDGRLSPASFLTYAAAARGRYADGTEQAKAWDDRIKTAQDSLAENDLAYRYELSQEYNQLAAFVAENAAGPSGGVSTSTTKRVILGADGKWKTVTSTTSKATAPSPSEVAAYKDRQIQVAAARSRMNAIAGKVASLPGGFVSTAEMMGFYEEQLTKYAKGSAQWYSIQGKLDSLADRLSDEKVLAKQGIKIAFPKVGSERAEKYGTGGASVAAPKPAAGGSGGSGGSSGGGGGKPSAASSDLTLEEFMAAIAKVESGGRYDARNSTTGAYGKYQILPQNWSSYAQRAGLPANAPMTPENQEIVARSAFERYYQSYNGDWAMMAAAWHAGVAGAKGTWGPRTRNYVSNVLGSAGVPYSGGRTAATAGPVGSGSGTPGSPAGSPKASGVPTVSVVTGVKYGTGERKQPRGTQQVDRADGPDAGEKSWSLAEVPIPVGYDGRAFEKLYAAAAEAFRDGRESFVVSFDGRQVQIFIGDDPDERIDFMRELNDLNIGLKDAKAEAYAGTPSEAAASQAAIDARKQAAAHEILVLDQIGRSGEGATPGAASNPVAAGLRAIDSIKAGIEKQVGLAQAAFDRGDYTVAYLHLKQAQKLSEPEVIGGVVTGDLARLDAYVTAAQERLSAIEAVTGFSASEALDGVGGGKTVLEDLSALTNWRDEIASAYDMGSEIASELDAILKKDGNGQVVWNGTGPAATAELADGWIRVVGPDGKVKAQLNRDVEANDAGGKGHVTPDNMTKVFLRSGSSVIEAYASYTIGRVGTMKLADGSLVPIMGKIVSVPVDANGDGQPDKTDSFFENPLSPGKWSASAIVINAPAGTKVVYAQGQPNQQAFQFDIDGTTYTMQPDAKTGVFVMWKQQKPGMFNPGSDPEPMGDALTSSEVASILETYGFQRDFGNADEMAKMFGELEAPALNFTPQQWIDARWKPLTATVSDVQKFRNAVAIGQAYKDLPGTTFKKAAPRNLGTAAGTDRRAYDGAGYDIGAPDRATDPLPPKSPTSMPTTGPVVKAKGYLPDKQSSALPEIRALPVNPLAAQEPQVKGMPIGGPRPIDSPPPEPKPKPKPKPRTIKKLPPVKPAPRVSTGPAVNVRSSIEQR